MTSESGEQGTENELFSRKLIVAAVLVGIFLIWIGQLVLVWSEWEQTETMKTMYRTATTLTSLGGMILTGALIAGSVINRSIDKFVRLGMLVVAALIVMQMTTWSASYMWQLLY
jgi:uncharacterized membrane protein